MQTFIVESPNTCGLVNNSGVPIYIDVVGALTFAPDTATFAEYLTPNDALAAALVIDPTYDGAAILGPMPVTIDTETGAGEYFYGDAVSLEFVVSSTVASTATYQWYEDDVAIPGATSSTLNLGNASSSIAGIYRCDATLTATDGSNRTASSGAIFSVTCIPVVGDFTLTRSGNDITTGLFTYLRGFTATTATIYVPSTALTITYDPVNGFSTSGSALPPTQDLVAELFINGVYVKTFTLHAVSGIFSYNFAA